IIVLDGVDIPETKRTNEQRALVPPSHLTCGQNARRPHLDFKSRRQLDLLDQRGEFLLRCAGRRARRRSQALLSFRLVAEKPVIRRMGPELLGSGLVFLQRSVLVLLLLRVDGTRPREKSNGRDCKNGSKEHGFHYLSSLRSRAAALMHCQASN